jgi:ABC-type antimicrobial peptide transport system permease subunit
MGLVGAFALAALVLAAIGIYGVVSYGVAQRTSEIGVRMALGAGRRDVLRLVVGGSLRLALAGVALGLVAALAVTRAMTTLLFGVTATDPATFAVTAAALAVVAVLASLVPALRATRIDPIEALRAE